MEQNSFRLVSRPFYPSDIRIPLNIHDTLPLVSQLQVLCRHHRRYPLHQVCPLRQGSNKFILSYVRSND